MALFKFKQFSVNQTHTPAKITTDATVFAASLNYLKKPLRVLEIGTGTGVLSLMIAQRFQDIHIDAVEINENAFAEATANFKNSPWSSRLKVLKIDFKELNSAKKYDLIFSNPPFFSNNLQSKVNAGKNLAYHTDALSFSDLAKGIDDNLSDGGEAHIMLPSHEMKLLQNEFNKIGFNCVKRVELKHAPKSNTLRVFSLFVRSGEQKNFPTSKIYIRDENENFHPLYKQLMKNFLIIF